ncbi:nutrient deprivation-induced protein [Pararhizobium sp.]|uniref:nutrient deprivation-induced protein n=1 Tax=Pararhizobium sp. TaxID=1977563 RepID=UPI003D1516EB
MPNEFDDPAMGSDVVPTTSPSSQPEIPASESPASFADLKEKVSEDMSAAKDTIKTGADSAVEKMKGVVSEQATYAARQVGGVATALQKVGTELEGSDQTEVGRYAKQIGLSVQSFAKQMEGKDVGEIANMAEEFGRKQPLAFLGIAALAGLTASRFLTASAKRTPSKIANSPATTFDSSRDGGQDNG